VSESTREAGRSGQTDQQAGMPVAPVSRLIGVVICVVVILVVVLATYFTARIMGDDELKGANLRVVQVQGENQKLTADNTNLKGTISDLQLQVKTAQDKLAAIMPVENTFIFNPNQSLVVADGRMTIGLVGSPTNEGVNININGKSQLAMVGAIINIALNPTTACQVSVQSFDMFRATLTATCSEIKPR
jgi:cell division protein FtsB